MIQIFRSPLRRDGRFCLALKVWNRWREEHSLGVRCQSYLPAIWQNLGQSVSAADAATFRELYQHFWIQNLRLQAAGKAATEVLERAGCESVLLKGANVAAGYLAGGALRPMSDFDLLIPEERLSSARKALLENGWRAEDDLPDSQLWDGHARALLHPCYPGCRVDLHWRALSECCWSGADERLWACRMLPSSRQGGTLAPAHELVLLFCNAARANSAASPWLLDAILILESDVDWVELVEEAGRRGVSQPVLEALVFLRAELDLAVPPESVEQLRQQVGLVERIYFWSKRHPTRLLARWGQAATDCWRCARRDSSPAGWRGFFERRWGVSGLGALMMQAVRRSLPTRNG